MDIKVRDSNGAQLAEGDTVTLIKDLKLKGSSTVLKRGTVIKNIHLTDDLDEIEGRTDKVKGLVLRTEFLKKAWSSHQIGSPDRRSDCAGPANKTARVTGWSRYPADTIQLSVTALLHPLCVRTSPRSRIALVRPSRRLDTEGEATKVRAAIQAELLRVAGEHDEFGGRHH